ncbi:MAG TPA: WbqC family protein [Verrucomicrobiae bacterium]|nr:WbqC family protein [Verrucomicrobiae bacterium]
MRIAVTQPYLFPYIAWYQVIDACDTFVIGDDFQYFKSGYINRNHILLGGRPSPFVVPLRRASRTALIGEREISGWHWAGRLLRSIATAYRRAPCFNEVYPLIEDIVSEPSPLLIDLLERAIVRTSRHLGLDRRIVRASRCHENRGLRGQERILDIARAMGADCYLQRETDAVRALYCHDLFAARGVELKFVRVGLLPYVQRRVREFIQGLSLIDFLMFVPPEERGRHLRAYAIVD